MSVRMHHQVLFNQIKMHHQVLPAAACNHAHISALYFDKNQLLDQVETLIQYYCYSRANITYHRVEFNSNGSFPI
jgi:hypothetical protein